MLILSHGVVLWTLLLKWPLPIALVWSDSDPAVGSAHNGKNASVSSNLLLSEVVLTVFVKSQVAWQGLSIRRVTVSVDELALIYS